MVAQVIVAVRHQHVEQHPAEELGEIALDVSRGAMRGDQLGQVEIAGVCLSIAPIEERHRRAEHAAPVPSAVEARDAERGVPRCESLQSRRGNVDARFSSELVHDELPGADVVPR